jgi:hypothetical protein
MTNIFWEINHLTVLTTDDSVGLIASIFRVKDSCIFPTHSEVIPHDLRRRELLATAPPQSGLSLDILAFELGRFKNFVTLKMEATYSTETSVLTRATRCNISEDIRHILRVFENRVLRKIFGPKRDGVTVHRGVECRMICTHRQV